MGNTLSSKGTPYHLSGTNLAVGSQILVLDALRTAGYNLTAGCSVDVSYSDSIELSFRIAQSSGINSGQVYWVTIVGDNTISSTQVTAS